MLLKAISKNTILHLQSKGAERIMVSQGLIVYIKSGHHIHLCNLYDVSSEGEDNAVLFRNKI